MKNLFSSESKDISYKFEIITIVSIVSILAISFILLEVFSVPSGNILRMFFLVGLILGIFLLILSVIRMLQISDNIKNIKK